MTTEMNETIFLQNLQKAIQEIILKENILFKIVNFGLIQ